MPSSMRRILALQCMDQVQRLKRAGVPVFFRRDIALEGKRILQMLDFSRKPEAERWNEALTRLEAMRGETSKMIRHTRFIQ